MKVLGTLHVLGSWFFVLCSLFFVLRASCFVLLGVPPN